MISAGRLRMLLQNENNIGNDYEIRIIIRGADFEVTQIATDPDDRIIYLTAVKPNMRKEVSQT